MSAVPQGHEKIDQRSIALHSAIAEKAARATRIAGDRAAERWIDSTIGEGSPFQRAFGYDAHGVGPETAVLPEGWRNRLVLVCGDDTLTGHRMVSRETLEQRLELADLAVDRRVSVQQLIGRQLRDCA